MRGLTVAVVTAHRVLPPQPNAVYSFLDQLANHRRIGDRYLRVTGIAPDQRGGVVVIAGPLGLRRTARTRVTTAIPPEQLSGTAAVGRHTLANVRWSIAEHEHGSHITLTATVTNAGLLDRLLLALGGEWWLRRRFEHVLAAITDAVRTGASTKVVDGGLTAF
jgi:hypothetical protein